MISYVLLITIAIIMSIIVFSYLRTIANVEPVIDCKDGTSIVLEDYECRTLEGEIVLNIRNNGRFNVDGFIATFGNTSVREPTMKLILKIGQGDILLNPNPTLPPFSPPRFARPLKPGELAEVIFSNLVKQPDGSPQPVSSHFLWNLKIQPYIIDEETNLRIPCGGKINRQDVELCRINAKVFQCSDADLNDDGSVSSEDRDIFLLCQDKQPGEEFCTEEVYVKSDFNNDAKVDALLDETILRGCFPQ